MQKASFDFEALYKLYPRKGEGKSKGLDKLRKTIRTEEDYLRVHKAITNYIALIEKTNRSPEYIKMWSTFCNNWEDYESAEELGLEPSPAKRLRVIT